MARFFLKKKNENETKPITNTRYDYDSDNKIVLLFAARNTVLTDMEEDTELFETFIFVFRAVKNVNGSPY